TMGTTQGFRSRDECARQRFCGPGIECVAQLGVESAYFRRARGERGFTLEHQGDLARTLAREPIVGKGVQIVVGQRQRGAHLTTLNVAGASAFIRRSFSRARFNRDMTVPIGTPWTRAMSS